MTHERKRPEESDFFRDNFHKREKQNGSSLSPSIKEYLPTFIVLAAALLLGLLLYASGIFSSTDITTPPKDPLFQARIIFPVGLIKVYEQGSDTKIKRLEAKVKNIGQSEAINVGIDLVIDGVASELPGPLSIGPGDEATYSVEGSFLLPESSDIRLKSSCWNCPLTPGPAPDPDTIASWRARQRLIHGIGVK
jgi:hypothetical protein